jgi:hypothetical protein
MEDRLELVYYLQNGNKDPKSKAFVVAHCPTKKANNAQKGEVSPSEAAEALKLFEGGGGGAKDFVATKFFVT